MIFSLAIYDLIYPFFLVDLYTSLILVIILSSLSILFIISSAFTGCSKYSILGCMRLISQLISFELLSPSIVMIFVLSFNHITISNRFPIKTNYVIYALFNNLLFMIYCLFFIFNNHLILFFFLITILAETNRVPFDLPEAEPESDFHN